MLKTDFRAASWYGPCSLFCLTGPPHSRQKIFFVLVYYMQKNKCSYFDVIFILPNIQLNTGSGEKMKKTSGLQIQIKTSTTM